MLILTLKIKHMESTHIHIPLHEGQYYHVYNRGNGGIPIFYNERNYYYFLKKYDEYLSDILETYSYCLLPNHFHLLVRIKDFQSFENLESLKLPYSKERTVENIVSELFRRFLMSYSKSINTQQNRKGSLFQKNFRRVQFYNCY
jgi:REP element-mobilizing transposase RayT